MNELEKTESSPPSALDYSLTLDKGVYTVKLHQTYEVK